MPQWTPTEKNYCSALYCAITDSFVTINTYWHHFGWIASGETYYCYWHYFTSIIFIFWRINLVITKFYDVSSSILIFRLLVYRVDGLFALPLVTLTDVTGLTIMNACSLFTCCVLTYVTPNEHDLGWVPSENWKKYRFIFIFLRFVDRNLLGGVRLERSLKTHKRSVSLIVVESNVHK